MFRDMYSFSTSPEVELRAFQWIWLKFWATDFSSWLHEW